MKKTIILLAIPFLTASLSAQVFNAGFEDNNGTPLSEWTTLNEDQNPIEDWMPVPELNEEGWVQFYDFYDNKIAFSTSFYMNGGAANDWLISPLIEIPNEGNPTLYWKAKSYDNTAPDTYAVKIFTEENGFQDLVVIEGEEAYEFNSRTLDLSDYRGIEVKIAFVNQTQGGYFLAVDDVYISLSDNCYGPEQSTFSSTLNISNPQDILDNQSINFEVNWEGVVETNLYDVGVTTFTEPVTSNGVQNETSKVYTNMNLGTRYQMFVKNADCGSGWMGPKSIFTPASLPYEHSFEPTEENYGEYDSDGWASDSWLMGINSELASEGEGYMFSNTSTSINVNKWLYSYPVILESNLQNLITFDVNYTANAVENGLLKVGFTTNNIVGSYPDYVEEIIVSPGQEQVTISLPVQPVGMYFVAFGNTSGITSDNYAIRLDNVEINQEVLATNNIEINNTIEVFPNPVKNILIVKNKEIINTIEVYDVSGKLVKNWFGVNNKEATLNFEDLSNGVYLIKVKTSNSAFTKKIIKK